MTTDYTPASTVLYQLVQDKNPRLTMPVADATFGTPAFCSAEDYASLGRNSQVALTVAGVDNATTITYDRLNPAGQRSIGNGWGIPHVVLPQGDYVTTQDLVGPLQDLGLPLTVDDIVDMPTINNSTVFTTPVTFSTPFVPACQLLPLASDSLGFGGELWVGIGPSAPIALSDFVTQQESPDGDSSLAYWGGNFPINPAIALQNYQNYYTNDYASGSGGVDINLHQAYVQFSDLTVLDAATSAAHGNAEVSAVVTAGLNGQWQASNVAFNWSQYWPYVIYQPVYSGSQTVYYSRPPFPTDLSQIFGTYPQLSTDANHSLEIPVGSLLGSTILTSQDLLTYLLTVANGGGGWPWNYGTEPMLFPEDVRLETLPLFDDSNSPITYTFTIENSYRWQDATFDVVLTRNLGDYTGTDLTTELTEPRLTNLTSWDMIDYLWDDRYNMIPNADIGTAIVNCWALQNPTSATLDWVPLQYWSQGVTLTLKAGTLVTTPTGGDSGSSWATQYSAEFTVATQWHDSEDGTTATIHWRSYRLSQLAYDAMSMSYPNALPMTMNFPVYTDSASYNQPKRVIDWLMGAYLLYNVSGNTSDDSLSSFRALSDYASLYVYDFDNLYDLVLPDADGRLSFTVTASPTSLLQEGSLTFQIFENTDIPALPTLYTPSEDPGWWSDNFPVNPS